MGDVSPASASATAFSATEAPVCSMTGAGTFVLESSVGRFEAEARSVNHRFFKATVRVVGPLSGAGVVVEAHLKQVVQRGHVTVHLRLRPASTDIAARIDGEAFARAAERLAALAAQHDLGAVTTGDVLRVPGVLGVPGEERSEQEEGPRATALDEVAAGITAALQTARVREGALLQREIISLLDAIGFAMADIEQHAGEVPASYQERLHKRLDTLLQGSGVTPDPAQIARECAALAEKSDVREEIARVGAHVQHAREVLEAGGAVGRRLDFLVQELHREANTIGSKANDLDLSRTVLDLKAAIERLREQVQNLA